MIDPRKAREVALCAQVAEQVNALEGTDYRAVAIERQDDIGDAKLVSATGRHPDRVMQVVSIPEDMELREDTDARQRLESRLCDALAARGIARAFLTIGLTQRGQKSGLSRDLVGQLVELILQGRDSAEVEWDGVQVAEHSEALSDYVNSIRLYKGPELDRVYINIPLFARPAGDGRWIKAAVDRKVARYGNANAVRDVALVIGALGLVSGDQITSFRRDVLEEELAFAEIWLVSGFEGVVRLKSRQG